jgi:hypothetical protein
VIVPVGSKNEGQKKAKTRGERRPMAGAAMLTHFKELERALELCSSTANLAVDTASSVWAMDSASSVAEVSKSGRAQLGPCECDGRRVLVRVELGCFPLFP